MKNFRVPSILCDTTVGGCGGLFDPRGITHHCKSCNENIKVVRSKDGTYTLTNPTIKNNKGHYEVTFVDNDENQVPVVASDNVPNFRDARYQVIRGMLLLAHLSGDRDLKRERLMIIRRELDFEISALEATN